MTNRHQDLIDKINEALRNQGTSIQSQSNELTEEERRIAGLSEKCKNIANSLNTIDQTLEQYKRTLASIEVSPEETNKALVDLNISEINCKNVRNKLEEILKLVNDNNQDLTEKKDQLEAELNEIGVELNRILTSLTNHQEILDRKQEVIDNYKAQLTRLETKITSNEKKADDVATKAGLLGTAITCSLASLLVILAKYWTKFRTNNE